MTDSALEHWGRKVLNALNALDICLYFSLNSCPRLSVSLSVCMYVFSQDTKLQKPRLSGYGVELAIKSTEYKAVDDSLVKGLSLFFSSLPFFLEFPSCDSCVFLICDGLQT